MESGGGEQRYPGRIERQLYSLSSVLEKLENLLKLEVWLIMKAVASLQAFNQRERGTLLKVSFSRKSLNSTGSLGKAESYTIKQSHD